MPPWTKIVSEMGFPLLLELEEGAGKFGGELYLSRSDVDQSKLYCLSIIDLEKLDNFDAIQDLVSIDRRIRHENVVHFLKLFIDHHTMIIITPYYLCRCDELISTKPSGINECDIAYILKNLLKALAYLHDQYYIHRAVTSANVLIEPNPGEKRTTRIMLDGLEHIVSQIRNDRVASVIYDFDQSLVETLNYASPELLSQSYGYSTLTDIYSVGVLACELANGINPFANMDPAEMLLEKLSGKAPILWDKTSLAKGSRHNPPPPQTLAKVTDNHHHHHIQHNYSVISSLRTRKFSSSFHSFVGKCVATDLHKRHSAVDLLGHHFIKSHYRKHHDLIKNLGLTDQRLHPHVMNTSLSHEDEYVEHSKTPSMDIEENSKANTDTDNYTSTRL